MKQRFTHCHNCNKIIKHKEILVTKKSYMKSLSKCEIQRQIIDGDCPDSELLIQVVKFTVPELEVTSSSLLAGCLGRLPPEI